MQGVAYTRYGGPEVTEIATVPTPTPAAGQVLVRVAAGGLNPVDAIQRSGQFKMIMPYTFPVVAGNEFSGTVTQLGDGVTNFAVGDNVYARVGKTELGGLGQYIAIDAKLVARAPTTISLPHAAGIPLAGLTAEQALEKLDVKEGDNVLITAGAGGVGLLAIQLAKIRGATVTTTASPAGEVLVRRVGADEVVNYKTTKLASLGRVFDKVFDCAGPDDAEALADVFAATKEGGSVVTIAGPPTPGLFSDYTAGIKGWIINTVIGWKSRTTINNAHAAGVSYEFMFMRPDGKGLEKLAGFVDEGKLEVIIDSRYPMADFAKAFERLESKRSKGKVIIEIEQES